MGPHIFSKSIFISTSDDELDADSVRRLERGGECTAQNTQITISNEVILLDTYGKSYLNKSVGDSSANPNPRVDKTELGKSKSHSGPSSPKNAHTLSTHSVLSRNKNDRNSKVTQQVYEKSANIDYRTSSLDTMTPIIGNIVSLADVKIDQNLSEGLCSEHDGEDKKEEGEIDEIEEMDEDLLYLRLMALRSIELRECTRDDDSLSNGTKVTNDLHYGDNEILVDEMEDLLNEADQAAKVSTNKIDLEDNDDVIEIIEREIPMIPVIDIPDSDEEQIDLELERWTKNKSISISSLDTTASFQPTLSSNHKSRSLLNDSIETNAGQLESKQETDYSELVQRLRETLDRQNQKKESDDKIRKSVKEKELLYSPSQSPLKEVLETNFDKASISVQASTSSQSPISEVPDTPIGSGGTTPENLAADLSIPLQLPTKNNKLDKILLNFDDHELPPLPPGSPPRRNSLPECALVEKPIGNNAYPVHRSYVEKTQPHLPNMELMGQVNTEAATPPPPGEDQVVDYRNLEILKTINNDTVDMDLSSDNEAEEQFFRAQQQEILKDRIFHPPSLPYSNHYSYNQHLFNPALDKNELTYTPKMCDVLSFDNDKDRYNAFLHAVSNKKISDKSSRKSSNRVDRRNRKRKHNTKWQVQKSDQVIFRGNNVISKKSKNILSHEESPGEENNTSYQRERRARENSEDDDPDRLRALLLSQIQGKKERERKSTVQRTTDPISIQSFTMDITSATESLVQTKTNSLAHPEIATGNQVAFEPNTGVGAGETNNPSLEINDEKYVGKVQASNAATQSPVWNLEDNRDKFIEEQYETNTSEGSNIHPTQPMTDDIRISSFTSKYPAVISELDKLSEDTLWVVRKIGVDAAIRNFPNLVKPVIIPYEDIRSSYLPLSTKPFANTSSLETDFATSLNNFMREARDKCSTNHSYIPRAKSKPPPKPIRKNPPKDSQVRRAISNSTKNRLTPHASPKSTSSISFAAKTHLMTASVNTLPLEKQEEYQRLKAIIARKESKKVSQTTDNNNQPIVNHQGQETEDEADALREALLSNMKLKCKMERKIVDNECNIGKDMMSPLEETSRLAKAGRSHDTRQPMTISISNTGNRNVTLDTLTNQSNIGMNDNSKKALLMEKENKIGFLRKDISNSLSKLSAQLSQLKNEKIRKSTAEEYLFNLKQKVLEVETLIGRKNERIKQIKDVVVHSHSEIGNRKKEILLLETQCQILGKDILGPSYQPLPGNSPEVVDKISLTQKKTNKSHPKLNTAEPNKDNPLQFDEFSQKKAVKNARASDTKTAPSHGTNPIITSNEIETTKQNTVRPLMEISGTGSALAHLRQSGNMVFDPHKEFCRYELQGKCNDDACGYQHQFPKVIDNR